MTQEESEVKITDLGGWTGGTAIYTENIYYIV